MSEPCDTGGGQDRSALRRALRLLQQAGSSDFSMYKPELLIQRFKRRRDLAGFADSAGYLDRIASDENEIAALAQDFQVGVTEFFREPELFERLEEEWIPALAEQFPGPLRVWIPGCSSGQEAYSVAMLLDEIVGGKGGRGFRIFATDVDSRALDKGLEGVFPKSSLGALSQARQDRYFEQDPATEDSVRICSRLRRSVVFARHDVLNEAPFGGIHLVSCRNLLIYLQESGQETVVANFRRALASGGLLILGSSEFLKWPSGFEVVDQKHRLFRRIEESAPKIGVGSRRGPLRDLRGGGDVPEQLLDRYVPRGFLISTTGRLLRSFGGAERYLRLPDRRPSDDLLDLLPVELTTPLVRAMSEARWDRERVHFPGVELMSPDGLTRSFDVSIEPLLESSASEDGPSSDSESTVFFLSFLPSRGGASEGSTAAHKAKGSGSDERSSCSQDKLLERLSMARNDRRRLAAELQEAKRSLKRESVQREEAQRELAALNDSLERVNRDRPE